MNRNMWFVIGGIVVVLLLAAGGLTAVRLLSTQAQAEKDYGSGVQVFEDVMDDGSGNPVSVRTVVQPAAELPDESAVGGGVITRNGDSSVFIGTGSTSVNVVVENGEPTVTTDFSGPELEAVLTRDTLFYQDETDLTLDFSQSGERVVQQKVREVERPLTFPEGGSITVWGEKRGDRIVATVVVFGEVQ
ncbi:MAG: hypothetical protein KC423_04400 [Anaerolineales bacterium]|nr:hypothetical protein [Anaerolineales bacterium]